MPVSESTCVRECVRVCVCVRVLVPGCVISNCIYIEGHALQFAMSSS